jgi:hypothetical protein
MLRVLLTLLIIHFCLLTVFAQVPKIVPNYPRYSPSQLKQDLDFIFEKYEEAHPNFYKETPKDTVLKRLEQLKAQITVPMNRVDFLNLFGPVLFNVVTDGHNYVNGTPEELDQYKKAGGLLFPLPVNMRDRRIYCNSNKGEIPFNAEITKINQINAKDVVTKVLSGYKAESDHFAEILNSQWFSTEYWRAYGGFQQYKVEYRMNDSLKTITIKGRTEKNIENLRLTTSTKNYSFYELPELKTGVIQYNVCDDLKNFRPFCDSVFNLMKVKNYKNLIIDIRPNVGGTTRLNEMLFEYLTNKPISEFDRIETRVSKVKKEDFIKMNRQYAGWFKWYDYLYYPVYILSNKNRRQLLMAKNGTMITKIFKPEIPKPSPLLFVGKIYLLTSEKTYSAAAIFAAAFKTYKLGTIVGQETGEPTNFTANSAEVTMPNTKLVCAISCDRFVLVGSKNDGHGVIPDVIIRHNDSSTVDQEMEYVKSIIKAQ